MVAIWLVVVSAFGVGVGLLGLVWRVVFGAV